VPLNRPRPRRWVVPIVAVFLLLGSGIVTAAPPVASPIASPAASPVTGPGDTASDLYDAVQPDLRDDIVAATAGRLSRYRIDAALIETRGRNPRKVEGQLDLRFVNDTGDALGEIYFRLYANDPIYGDGDMEIGKATVASTPVAPELSVDDTVLRVPLPRRLVSGAAIDLTLAFTAMVPVGPTSGYGLFAFQPKPSTWVLAHWYPMIAGHDAGGWNLDPVSRNGDPIFSNTSLYDVRLTTPGGLEVVATGDETANETQGATIQHRYVSGPVRDFTIVADDNLASVSREEGGTTITSFYDPTDAEGGTRVLDAAVRALHTFTDRLGPYPYREMDLVQVPLQGASGVEFPQLLFLGSDIYGDPSRYRAPNYLEFVTAHEVGHQWFYALVGNNQYDHAFIDEGLVEYLSSDVYFGDQYGAAAGDRTYKLETEVWYLSQLFSVGDEVIDQPTDDFPTEAAYGATVYGKGAVAFHALRADIGDDAFFTALRDYAARYQFAIATPADLRAAFERAAGRDLGPFWTSWFERADGLKVFSPDDYAALRAELGLG